MSERARSWAALLVLFSLLALVACGGGEGSAKPPELPDRYAKCSIKKSGSRPLIVEWPSTDRAELESLSKRGLVVVRYSGCEMELLSRCRVKGSYKYTAVTSQSEHITIHDADELYAQLPVGAAKLEGQLDKSGQLNVDSTVVGTFDADAGTVSRGQLEGDCGAATHVALLYANIGRSRRVNYGGEESSGFWDPWGMTSPGAGAALADGRLVEGGEHGRHTGSLREASGTASGEPRFPPRAAPGTSSPWKTRPPSGSRTASARSSARRSVVAPAGFASSPCRATCS